MPFKPFPKKGAKGANAPAAKQTPGAPMPGKQMTQPLMNEHAASIHQTPMPQTGGAPKRVSPNAGRKR